MRRSRTAITGVIIALACASAGCSKPHLAPAGQKWGLPIYPHASVIGTSAATASFVLYRTADDVSTVDAWYAVELPRGVSHAYDAARGRSTFALFDPHDRRTVHIEREGSYTAIMLTELKNP